MVLCPKCKSEMRDVNDGTSALKWVCDNCGYGNTHYIITDAAKEYEEKKTKGQRGIDAGIHMADSMIEWAHMMYNAGTAKRVINAMIKRLQDRVKEYKPVKKKDKKNG